MERVSLEVQAAERDYDLNRAAELKYGTLLQLQKQLREAEEMLEREMVCARAPATWPCVFTCARRADTACMGGLRPTTRVLGTRALVSCSQRQPSTRHMRGFAILLLRASWLSKMPGMFSRLVYLEHLALGQSGQIVIPPA